MRLVLLTGMMLALVACGDDDDDGMLVKNDASSDAHVHSPIDSGADHPPPDSSMSVLDSGRDGSTQDACEQHDAAFQQFLSQHQECEVEDDCMVIGDCGPNADFRAIRTDAADEGYELMRKRCVGTYDGPVYKPVCRANRCDLEMITTTCCGCPTTPDSDAGGP